jgi:hypothetical protein
VVLQRDANQLATGAHTTLREQLLECILDCAFRNCQRGGYLLVGKSLNEEAENLLSFAKNMSVPSTFTLREKSRFSCWP